jgi:anti-anti-sigma factor
MADTASRPLTDRIVRVTVEEIDRATVDQFTRELTTHEPGPYCLVVDVRDVTFIDAGGVQALLTVAQDMWAVGGVIAVRRAGRAVRRILDLLGLSELLAPD